jgi:predicted small lipoprotein YifL
LSAAVLALGGCGRKGPLDLPPTAQHPVAATPAEAEAQAQAQAQASQPSLFNPNYGTDAPPAAAKGQKKSFLLDPILGNN